MKVGIIKKRALFVHDKMRIWQCASLETDKEICKLSTIIANISDHLLDVIWSVFVTRREESETVILDHSSALGA